MRMSPFYVPILIMSVALAACQSTPDSVTSLSSTTPGVAFSRTQDCQLQGGGVDGNGEVVPTARKHRSAIRIEGIFTVCSQENVGTWFKVYSFIDDGTESGHRILLAADHDPVVLRQATYSSGTVTSWQVNIDFVPSSEPLAKPNGFQPRVLLEAYGHGGKIGEVACYLDDSPDAGPRGPHRRGD